MGQNYADIQKNHANFKRKLRLVSEENLKILDKLDQETEKEYLELFDKNRFNYLPPDSNFPKHKGYYYPVLLNEQYGLLLKCSLAENQQINDFTWLKDLQKLVVDRVSNQKGRLGETWFFSAQLGNLEQSEELATKIYQTLIPDTNVTDNLIAKSDFLNGELFEYLKKNDNKQHVIISFYREKTSLDQEPKFYPYWMRLLLYHHQITWAYNQSHQLANKLKQGATNIKDTEQQLQICIKGTNLEIQQLYRILHDYVINLDELHDQMYTIEINLGNYQKRLKILSEKSASSLTGFENFHNLVKEKYFLQVQKDYETFSSKLTRLENITNYIKATIAIKEETRDRKLFNTINFSAAGLAVGAIVSSIIEQVPFISTATGWYKFIYSLGFSIGSAILAGFLFMKLMNWWKQK